MNISPAAADRILRDVLAIDIEGTSESPIGYGPPYGAPWHIIDRSTAEPEVNWPGTLVAQVDDAGEIAIRLQAARVETFVASLAKEIAQEHDKRVTELLEANNRYQQEARDARAALRQAQQEVRQLRERA